MRGIYYWIVAIVITSFALGAYIYPFMPEVIASHWNAQGVVDGHMNKFAAIFTMPLISVILLGLFIVIPTIDPKKKNIEKFRGHFDAFILIVFVFLFYIYVLTILWNLGLAFNLVQLMSPGFALLFYCCGMLLEHSKRNWFVGIRTPWTMSSDKVWDKTHKLGAKLFKAAGIISLLGMALPDYAIVWVLAPIILFAIYLFVYSYFEYEKIKK